MLLKTTLALLLAVPGAGAAQQTAVATAAVQASTASAVAELPAAHAPALRRLMRDLNLLLERGGGVAPEKLDALAVETKKFNAVLRETLGAEILADLIRREDAERSETAKRILARFRAELQVYYATNGGKYPASPARLVPDQITSVPALELPGHEASSAITLIDSKKFDRDASKAITDSGGWLYFTATDSANYGLLLIDCSHREPGGEEFYKY